MGKRKQPSRRYRIGVDTDKCIGCAMCTRCKVFEIGRDMRAHAVRMEAAEPGCCKEVAKACPVGAIQVKPVTLIWPAKRSWSSARAPTARK